MTTYDVIGDVFAPDSQSLEKDKPSYFDLALESSEFAPQGFGYNVNYGRDEVTLDGGYARLYDGSQAWHVFIDGKETLDFETNTGTNYFFVAYDVESDQLYFEVNATGTEPSDPALNILEIDAGRQTGKKKNREPIVDFGSTVYNTEDGTKKQEIKYDPQLDTLVLIKYD